MATQTRTVVATAGVVGLMVALTSGCKKPADAGGGGMPGTPVTQVMAVARDVPVYIDEIGRTTAVESVTVVPQVSGKILRQHIKHGDTVRKGQLLFEIDPRPFEAVLQQAQAQKQKDQATLESAAWNVKHDTDALSTKAISEQQLHNDTATQMTATAAVAADDAAIAQAKLNVEYSKIVSPIDGRAGEILVDPGNVVNGGGQMAGTQLVVVNKIDPIFADFTVTEAQLADVQRYMAAGQLTVTVMTQADADMAAAAAHPPTPPPMAAPHESEVPADKPATGGPATGPTTGPTTAPAAFQPRTGTLVFLDNAVQDASGTVKLRARLENRDEHFWPGQFVRVRLVLTHQRSVMIPFDAPQISQQGPFVYKVVQNDKSPTKAIATLQPVTIGQRQGDLVVIDTGLNDGDAVVSSGFTLLQPDAPVMVINAAPPGVGPQNAAPPKVGPGTLKSPATDGQSKGGPQASAAGTHATEGGRL